ncbi:MAG TPA: pitrilysin family protein, partial [Candidatus Saccharimonadia bacterium]|nr:pitrilysin family protein [Candidatus Saccharimonadia bacterium]
MKHTVHEHKLASGAEGLIIHVPGSAVASVRIAFHSGFQFGKRSIYEVPHVMEHLLATVTKRHAQPNAFMIEAQKNGAYVNASTSTDTNEYIYECAAFELERMLDLIEEQVCEPLFAPEPFTAEVSNVREELIRNTTQHMAVCSLKLSERVFPQLWLGYDERIAQLDSLKLEQLEEHYHRTHTAANARFYLAGDFPDGGAAVAERFERTFARLPKGHRLPLDHAMGRGLERPVVTRRDIDQVYYRTGRYFGEIAPDQLPVLSLYNVLLVGGMASRVLGEARRRGLAYSVGTSAYAQRGNSGFGFAGYVTPDHAADLFEVMTRHVQALADGECTTEELSAAKDLLVGSIARSTQTAGDILGWYTERYDEEGEIRDFDQTLEQLRGVTGEEIAALGRV